MTPRHVRQWIARVGLLGGMTLVLAGCPEDASDITEVASVPSFDFPVAGAYVEPAGSGSLENFVLAAFDPTLSTDAFSRATGDSGFVFSGSRYLIDDAARTAATDPRLPALGGIGTEDIDPPSACRFGASNFWFSASNPGFGWDFFCFLKGLKPNTDYSVMLVRYSLTVNGLLDTEEMLLTGAITSPDQLTVLGGTPGGYPTELCDFDLARPTYTIGVTGSQNPLVMGFVTTDGAGLLVFDCLVGSGAFWAENQLSAPDSAPFAPNSIKTFALPRYNYVVVVEGTGTNAAPVPAGAHVMRFQVGVDIDASGAPIANGLAPLANAAATDAELLFASGGAGKPDSIDVTFNNLEALAGGAVYEAWLMNPLTGSAALASGTYERIKIIAERDPITGDVVSTRDSVVETVAGVSSFVGGNQEDGFRHRLTISDASLAGGASDTVGFHSHLVLTIASSPGGATPSATRPLWFNYTNQNGTPTNFFDDAFDPDGGATNFGNFDASDPLLSRVYSGQGQGLGGVRGDVFSVDLAALSRPPVGYSLVGWLVRADGSAMRLGDVTGPGPDFVSLVDADVNLVEGVVTANGILDANFRVLANEAGIEFKDFPTVLITLEPKAGDAGLGPIPVQIGALPARVLKPPE